MFQSFFTMARWAIICLLPIWALTAQAEGPIYTGGWFGGGAAIRGYDPVAYFTVGAPTKGDASISHSHGGADWHFSSTANRERFIAHPEKYLPQYGGHCAYAMGSYNELVKVDPEVWAIVDGKLYLNYSNSVQSKWEAERAQLIRAADANWPQHLKAAER